MVGERPPAHFRQSLRCEATKLVRDAEVPQHGLDSELGRLPLHADQGHRLSGHFRGIKPRKPCFLQLRDILLHTRICPAFRQRGELHRINQSRHPLCWREQDGGGEEDQDAETGNPGAELENRLEEGHPLCMERNRQDESWSSRIDRAVGGNGLGLGTSCALHARGKMAGGKTRR